MARVEIYNVGSVGIIKDLPEHYLIPEAWSDGANMRFQDRVATKFKGHSQVFGTPTVAPGFMLNVPVGSTIYWIYTNLTKAYVYESAIHTNITRQTAGVDVNYTATEYRQWNGGILGGIPILNNGVDLPQYWTSLSPSSKLDDLTAWPSTLRARILRPFGPFLVALNINDNGTLYPHMVWWSHPSEPGALPSSWDYTDPAFDCGRKELTDVEGGQILDALMFKNLLIIYKETSTHYMRYVGGQEIMANDLLFANSGILASRCVCLIDRGRRHFVATIDDVIWHNGQEIESVLDEKSRKFLLADRDALYFANSFCCDNPAQREAWFCYPSSGSIYPNKVLAWNYANKTIQFRDFVGNYATPGSSVESMASAWSALSDTWDTVTAPWSEEGKRQLIAGSVENTKFYKMDSGELFDDQLMTSFLERRGLAIIGKDRQGQPKADLSKKKLCKRIWPKITGTSPVTIRIGSQDLVDGDVTWASAQTFTPGTDLYLDFTVMGRFLAVRFEASADASWQLEGYDLDIELVGDF